MHWKLGMFRTTKVYSWVEKILNLVVIKLKAVLYVFET